MEGHSQVSPKQKKEAEVRAKAFIDEIIAINRRYGMDGKMPKEVYETAVKNSARSIAPLVGRNSRSTSSAA